MKAMVKDKRAPKRNLFDELREGLTTLAEVRQGKRTLRTHAVEFKPAPEVTARELIRVRQHLKLSRALFWPCLVRQFRGVSWDAIVPA